MKSNLKAAILKLRKLIGDKEINILAGGKSSESDVSLISSTRVLKTLKKFGFKSKIINPELNKKTLLSKLKNTKIVFLGLHGGYGENGIVQGWLDFNKIKYTGSNVLTSAIGMNKIITKKLLSSEMISTPDFIEFVKLNNLKKFIIKSEEELKYPLFIKVADEGSGNGVYLIKSRNEFIKIFNKIKSKSNVNMIYTEKFIRGRELAVSTFETENKLVVFPILEAKYEGLFFDKNIRSKTNGYKNEVPAKIDLKTKRSLEMIATTAHKSLFANSYLRLDIRLEEMTNKPYIIEATTLPGLTEKSWLPAMSQKYGYTFDEFIITTLLSTLKNKYDKS